MFRLSLAAALLCSLLPAQQQACTTTFTGAGCGATLTVSFPPVGNHHQVQLDAAGLFPQEIGAMMWAVDLAPAPWPVIPGSPCLIHSIPVWSHLFMADATGSATIQRAWPLSYQGWFYMQMGGLHVLPNGSFTVVVSNTELAECHHK